VALPTGLAGHAFTAVSEKGDADVDLWDACDGQNGNPVSGGQFFGPKDEAGTVPAGAGCVIVWDGGAGATGTITFTVT
jgi:hypothetical protein